MLNRTHKRSYRKWWNLGAGSQKFVDENLIIEHLMGCSMLDGRRWGRTFLEEAPVVAKKKASSDEDLLSQFERYRMRIFLRLKVKDEMNVNLISNCWWNYHSRLGPYAGYLPTSAKKNFFFFFELQAATSTAIENVTQTIYDNVNTLCLAVFKASGFTWWSVSECVSLWIMFKVMSVSILILNILLFRFVPYR